MRVLIEIPESPGLTKVLNSQELEFHAGGSAVSVWKRKVRIIEDTDEVIIKGKL
jgi:hypothetical protein